MNTEVIVTCFLIVLARIGDVSLGTMRTISVVQGRAFLAWMLGFFEVLIWVLAASKVLNNLESPFYIVAYAFGFACGNYIGVKLEGYVAFGRQVVRVFSHRGAELAALLRDRGHLVTTFEGQGREGHVSLLFIETRRRLTPRLLREAAQADPGCFYMVDDIRLASQPAPIHPTATGWRAVLKKK
ncbi:MAG: DUF2179 domain-containing protein [Phycisphaerae bacterium]|nr:DUF2179 domain-containing protein [Phycisphaerae bacterium]